MQPMKLAITGFESLDLRFPTSQHLDGSDAMNPDPDYSAAYVILKTEAIELHLSIIDFACVSATLKDRIAEYSDHLHEQVCHPVQMHNGRYMPPNSPGYSVEFTDQAIQSHTHRP